jgi:hypothetical protein
LPSRNHKCIFAIIVKIAQLSKPNKPKSLIDEELPLESEIVAFSAKLDYHWKRPLPRGMNTWQQCGGKPTKTEVRMTKGECWKRFFEHKGWITDDVISAGKGEKLVISICQSSMTVESGETVVDSALILKDFDLLCMKRVPEQSSSIGTTSFKSNSR